MRLMHHAIRFASQPHTSQSGMAARCHHDNRHRVLSVAQVLLGGDALLSVGAAIGDAYQLDAGEKMPKSRANYPPVNCPPVWNVSGVGKRTGQEESMGYDGKRR